MAWAVMDGKTEKYRSDDYPRTRNGELTITEYYGITGGLKEGSRFPLLNIREWRAEQR